MSKTQNSLHVFWGAAIGVALSELAIAQLATAATLEQRVSLALELAARGEIKGGVLAASPKGGGDRFAGGCEPVTEGPAMDEGEPQIDLPVILGEEFDMEIWADVVTIWDKLDEPIDPWDKETEMPEDPELDFFEQLTPESN